MSEINEIQAAAAYIRARIPRLPALALILGSGLGVLADQITEPVRIPYGEIPGFPVSTVEGHAGQLVIGELGGLTVAAMQGRFHYYEGYAMRKLTFPVRVLASLGITRLIVTNAAGGINELFQPGDLMLIRDHINMMHDNPLIGPNDANVGPRFPDMSQAYSRKLGELARQVARDQDLPLREGVYLAFSGPTYETPAEVRMARLLGGDAAGMSTVPEVIVARHMGIEVLGISCITNMAAGIIDQPLDHAEVMETAEKVRGRFLAFLQEIIRRMGN